jgi:hypothetical protein
MGQMMELLLKLSGRLTPKLRLAVVLLCLGETAILAQSPDDRIKAGQALDLQTTLGPERKAAALLAKVMEDAPEITLYSIDPESGSKALGPNVPVITIPGLFGSWAITGSAKLSNRETIAVLASSLESMVDHNERLAFECIEPRHALRFKRGASEVTILICFECCQCYVTGFPESATGFFHIGPPSKWVSEAQFTWNHIFREAGLTLQVDSPIRPHGPSGR